MLSPEYLEHLPDNLVNLYRQYQDDLIADMSRRMVRMGMSDTTTWQMEMAQAAGGVYQDAIGRIAQLTNKTEREVRRMFEDTGAKAIEYDNKVFEMAGLSPVPLSLSPALRQILSAGIAKTLGDVRNMTMTTAVTSQTAYLQAANRAYMQVVNGGMSYTEAIRRAVIDLADQGVTSVLYDKSGKAIRHKADVAVRRAVLTGVSQTAAQVQMANMDRMGGEYVETSAHMGARPDHAAWQGRQFHRGGAVPGYPDFVSSTRYGEGKGLCGWNCRHSFYAFWPGLSQPNYTLEQLREMAEKTVTVDGNQIPLYEAAQAQRKMERDIRASKRELAALDSVIGFSDKATAAALRDEFAQVSIKLKAQEAKLKAYLNKTGLNRQREREQVVGFGRSAAQKAVQASKQMLSSVSIVTPVVQNGMSKGYQDILSSRMKHNTKASRAAFKKFAPADSVADGAWIGTPHYAPGTKKIMMSFADDAKNLRGAGATFFHEHGHLIDHAANYPSLRAGELESVLKKDYNAYVRAYMKKHGITSEVVARAAISADLQDAGGHLQSAVSDLMDALSAGKIIGFYGHRRSYWSDPSKLAKEAWAHMYEAQTSPSRRKLLRQYFPTASKWFEKMLEVISR